MSEQNPNRPEGEGMPSKGQVTPPPGPASLGPAQPVHDDPFGLDGGATHKPEEEKEVIYFEGSPRLRSELASLVGNWLAGIAIIAGTITLAIYVEWVRNLGAWLAIPILIGVLVLLIPILKVYRVKYRITNYRIDFERGLFTKSIDTLELWHVNDVKFHQSVWARIMRVGVITVLSSDKTTPELHLKGLPDPRPIFESLKNRVIAVKRQRGVIKMDVG